MPYNFAKVTALIVEDNQPMLDITKSLLTTFGVGRVIGAKDGEEGFDLFKKYEPDLIIADWMMRPMDGISFTRLVRNDPMSTNPYVPVILMTGFSEKRRVIQARDVGVTEFLVKPFNARELYRRLSQVIERPRQFVHAEGFFGPDRRRRTDINYTGPMRRESDHEETEDSPIKTPEELQIEKRKAYETLQKIRGEAGLEKGDRFDLSKSERTN